jgi:hypothetical protein
MSFLKFNSGAYVILIALAMLAAGSKIALADTTNLICHMNDNKFWVEEGPTTIELNEAQSSVVINYAPYHGKTPRYTGPSAVTKGPFQATFGAHTITWQEKNGENGYVNYTINRVTGFFVGHLFYDGKDGGYTNSYTCHAGQKQF